MYELFYIHRSSCICFNALRVIKLCVMKWEKRTNHQILPLKHKYIIKYVHLVTTSENYLARVIRIITTTIICILVSTNVKSSLEYLPLLFSFDGSAFWIVIAKKMLVAV